MNACLSNSKRAAALLALPLVACATSRIPSQTQVASDLTPANWSAQVSAADVSDDWISNFRDGRLDALVDEAMANNFGLESAAQRANAAAAAARISGSLRIPSINASLRSGRQKTLANPAGPTFLEGESHSLSLGAQWEVDLWNRIGNAAAASGAQAQATLHDYEALRLSLASQVSKAWFNAIEAYEQSRLAEASAQSFDTKLDSLEKRYQRGLGDAFDLRLVRAQAASARSASLTRRSQLDASIRLLETLLGRYPSGSIPIVAELPPLPSTPPAGIPSSLLERRPDLQAQERRLAASLATATSARRNWLPSVVLSASDGTAATRFADLLDESFNVWSLAGSIAQPIFQGGRLKAERAQAEANLLSSIAQYKDTALRAFREVETALQAETDLAALEDQSTIAANESRLAEEQSWSLYERGLVDISAALDSERRSFDAQSQLISVRNRRLQNRVDLHIALGGGF